MRSWLVAAAALLLGACRESTDRAPQGKAQPPPRVQLTAPVTVTPGQPAPQGNAIAPQGNAIAPQGNAIAPQGNAIAPQGNAIAPQGSAPAQAAPPVPPAPPPPPPGLTPARLAQIQAALQAAKLDGWLVTDFRRSDPIAWRLLGLDVSGEQIATRRWFCFIPARGQPQKLLHAIEPTLLDLVPGHAATYSSWRQRDRELGRIVRGLRAVAMDYSARNDIPTASRVDAGTVELVRSLGAEVVSSAELIALLESTLSPEELAGQARAAALLAADLDATAQEAARRLKAGQPATERDLQDFVLARWAQEGLTADGGRPLVAVDAHTAQPHYSAPAQGSAVAGQNSVLLLDFAARLANDPRAIYADLTRVYFLGDKTPDDLARVAGTVFKARDAALELLRFRAEWKRTVTGAEVDAAARKVITDAGQGERFLHRTGHSIGTRAHGEGVNNDDYETHDTRQHLPDTCFSVEPGVYVAGRYGVRSEIDVCLVRDAQGKLLVDVRGGPLQTAVPALLAN